MAAVTPRVTIETITPGMAQQMLAANILNRGIRFARVSKYASDMAGGRWELTGEPIILNGSTLVNGQHRLLACVEAGVPFKTAIFRGAGDQVYAVVDSGLSRTAGDTLNHQGVKNANMVAAASRLVIGYNAQALNNTTLLSTLTTHVAISEEVARDPSRYEALSTHTKAIRKPGFGVSAFIAFGVILGEAVGKDPCDEWLYGAIEGVGLGVGDSRIAMRNWVIGNRGRARGPVELSAWIRARNAFALSEPRTIIKPWFKGTPFPRLIEEQS